MNLAAVFAPVFVQVTLTFLLLFYMGYARYGAINRKEVVFNEAALGQSRWPPRVQQISNAFHNQLEIPIFFYALVAFALIADRTGAFFVALSWLFVLSRLAHAFIHVTSNNVRYRGPAYLVGVVILMAMWVSFALSVLTVSP